MDTIDLDAIIKDKIWKTRRRPGKGMRWRETRYKRGQILPRYRIKGWKDRH